MEPGKDGGKKGDRPLFGSDSCTPIASRGLDVHQSYICPVQIEMPYVSITYSGAVIIFHILNLTPHFSNMLHQIIYSEQKVGASGKLVNVLKYISLNGRALDRIGRLWT